MPRRRTQRLFPAKRRRRRRGVSGLLLLMPVLLAFTYPQVVLAATVIVMLIGCVVWWLRGHERRRDRRALIQLDLAGVDNLDPRRFEAFVAELLTARGYRTQLTQASHDFGVDVVASRGSERLAVQVKHYSRAVSGKAIAEALLGMPHYGCNACMVVTNSCFTRSAVKAALPHPCTLIDRQGLAAWLQEVRSQA